MKIFHSLCTIVLLVSALLLISGCAPQKVDQGPIVLKFITDQVAEGDPGADAIKHRVTEFNALNPTKVTVEIVAIPEHTQMINRLQTNVASDTPMDLFWVIDNIRSDKFWAKGYLADLTPVVDKEFRSYKSEEHWTDVTVDGQVQAIPYFSTLVGMYYNKEIFAKAGVTLPLKTWDDFFAAGDKIKAAGYVPIALDTLNTAWLTMLTYSAYVGGELGPEYLTGRTTFSDPVFTRGAEFLKKLKKYTTSDVVGVIYNVAANYFIQGKAAMIPNGGWMIGQFDKDFSKKVGVMPFPGQPGKSEQVVIDGPIAKLATSKLAAKDPARLAAIGEFMKWFSKPENIRKTIIESGLSYTGTVKFGPDDPINPILAELINSAASASFAIPRIRDTVPQGFYTGFEEEIAKFWNETTDTEKFIANLNKKTFEN